jgi:predicted AlkP superfamily phosphohydrolase/phosphomutase
MTKVFIAGLDGATFDLIRPWAAAGELPTLHRLMTEGTWGPLESTIPPMTSPAWPSFATGKYPAKHGVFDFVAARGGTFNVINATAVGARALWDILSAHGSSVGVMNVPVTYPPHAVNGFMITGLLSPSNAQITYPSDLLTRYNGKLPRYRVMPTVQYKPGNEEAFIQDLEALVDIRAEFAAQLMQDHRPWDFMMVHFLATDLVQHALWRHMDPSHPRHEPGNPFQDAILHIYQHVDAALGRLLATLDGETTVMVMSDHGFGPLHGVVNLNMLLLKEGLLRLKRDPLTQIRAFLSQHGMTPAQAYEWLVRLNLQNIVSRVSKSTRNAVFNKFLSFDDIDWSRTIAYSLGHMGQVYVNVKGREPNGIVERGVDCERACERVISALYTLTTPDGRPMVERIIRKHEITAGEHADEGPDLHVMLDGYRYISCPLFATDGNVISKQIRGDSGCHRLHGILIAQGPHIRAGGQVKSARIVDLAPTTLHLMGHPTPGDMDGHVLTGILTPAFLARYPAQVEATAAQTSQGADSQQPYFLSDQEEAELELRLKGLGYLG